MNETYLFSIKQWAAATAQSCSAASMRCMMRTLYLLMSLAAGVALAVALAVAPAYAEAPAEPVSAMAATTLDKVNINTANAQTLEEKLVGIGEARAGDIVRYREIYGLFVSADELAEVKGIGQSTVDRNRDVITLE